MMQKQANVNFPNLPRLMDVRPDLTSDPRRYFTQVGMRWYHVLDRFRTYLPHLRHFSMGMGDWADNMAFEQRYELKCELFSSRYYMFDCGSLPSQWIGSTWEDKHGFALQSLQNRTVVDFPHCIDEDDETLTELVETVLERPGSYCM